MFSKIKKIFKNDNKKPHLLIVGDNLKFIEHAVKYLEKDYEIKTRVIQKNDNLDSSKNKNILDWADIIFCEWMQSYVEWFSKNVKKDQKLFIRAHKYEASLSYGHNIDFNNVTGVITINYFLLEIFSNIFSIPREKMFVLNNIVETSIYSKNKTPDYRKNIALVGYVPNWKGYHRALEIINHLNKHDDFKLYLFGKDWCELDWVKNDKTQFEYLDKCEEYIEEHDLSKYIIKQGWVDRTNMFSNIGYVLSVSDIEGSHLSPTESNADLTMSLILNWPGASYVHPPEIIFESIDDIEAYILDTYDNDEKYMETVKFLNNYCVAEFGEEYFVNGLKHIFSMEKTDNNNFSISLEKIKNEYIENNEINQEKLLNDFDNSFIAYNETEIQKIIKNNSKSNIRIFLSKDFETYKIKNIYQKYASINVAIYSIHFLENLDEAEEFIRLINKYHRSDKKLK